MGNQPKWESQSEEKSYKDMKAGYAEYEASRRDDSLLFMNKPRIIVNEKGEETLSLWAYGKLPLRLMSDVVGFLERVVHFTLIFGMSDVWSIEGQYNTTRVFTGTAI